jgi:ATP-binding cassette subfamily B multidrug efflux pump
MATVARVGGQAILSGGTLLGATIPLGLVITFLNYVQRLNQPTMQISVLWTNIQSAIAGGERIFGLMDAKPDVTDKVDAVEMPSIVKLLPRFYDVTDGRVLVDGYDVRDVTRDSLRSQIGIVLQDTFLFSESVMENIRCGRPDATGEQVMAAARLAKVDTFIERLPEKHDTVLGERGSGLSQ